MIEYEYHRYADVFPMMYGADFDNLVTDIKANGQLEPIVLLDGQILDGRNRYRACQKLGLAPRTIDYAGNDPVTYVISKNLHRRHLTSSQRAAAAVWGDTIMAELEAAAEQRMKAGKAVDPNKLVYEGQVIDQVAAAFDTNRQYVQDAKTLRDEAPDLLKQVVDGKKSLPHAKREHRQRTGYEPSKKPPRSTTRSPSPEEVERLSWRAFYRDIDDQQPAVSPEVAEVLKGLRTFEQQLCAFKQTASAGKMSPEAKRFTARKLEKICNDLTDWAVELKEQGHA